MEFAPEGVTSALPLAASQEESPLIADQVLGAMQENLAALAMLAEPPARPQIVRSGETSLEGLTRELLRPMLAEWLEANLPAMVEQMVQAEIARIVGKRP
jgi:cell pole-organizing protein PopZ